MNNIMSETDERVNKFNRTFDDLVQEFHNKATGHTLVTVHRIWGRLKDWRESFKSFCERLG
jgi:hypothetical protein